MTIYTSILCRDGVTVLMCPCMLVANSGLLLYWMNVYAYVLCMYYMSMWILAHNRSLYNSMYGLSISLHPTSYNIKRCHQAFLIPHVHIVSYKGL